MPSILARAYSSISLKSWSNAVWTALASAKWRAEQVSYLTRKPSSFLSTSLSSSPANETLLLEVWLCLLLLEGWLGVLWELSCEALASLSNLSTEEPDSIFFSSLKPLHRNHLLIEVVLIRVSSSLILHPLSASLVGATIIKQSLEGSSQYDCSI